MASIITGYEYNICLRLSHGRQVFISYGQKDNKGSWHGAPLFGATQSREAGWVSEFVKVDSRI
jgi:hypothetical protein